MGTICTGSDRERDVEKEEKTKITDKIKKRIVRIERRERLHLTEPKRSTRMLKEGTIIVLIISFPVFTLVRLCL